MHPAHCHQLLLIFTYFSISYKEVVVISQKWLYFCHHVSDSHAALQSEMLHQGQEHGIVIKSLAQKPSCSWYRYLILQKVRNTMKMVKKQIADNGIKIYLSFIFKVLMALCIRLLIDEGK